MNSDQTHHSASARNGKHINQSERQQIERWLKGKKSVAQSAALLNSHRATIYREIKRGLALHYKCDHSSQMLYQADRAQTYRDENLGCGGPRVKLRYLMNTRRLSPYAALKTIQKKHPVPFCQRTLYNYINLYNMPIERSSLPMKGRRRRGKACSFTGSARHHVRGTSIEQRPAEIHSRSEAGHWEMELVVDRAGSKKTLLVLTKRKLTA